MREKRRCVRARNGSHGLIEINNYISGGCLLTLSMCRRIFQGLLNVRPSSPFMLCGSISSSMASLMSRSICPFLAEKSFVFSSLIIWSLLTLCSATADLSVCVYCVH